MKSIDKVVQAIIDHQEMVIGPLAYEQAKKVEGVRIINQKNIQVVIKKGEEKKLLSDLVMKYETVFGEASVEVCKDAVRESASDFPPDQLPDILKE